MIANGCRILTHKPHVDELVTAAFATGAPSLPALYAATADTVDLTYLHRPDTKLPRHILKRHRKRLVILSDVALPDADGSPGPAAWPIANSLHRYEPVACLIHSNTADAEQYLAAVTLAIEAGPVLLIECGSERVSDWEWLVTPWCPTVAVLQRKA